MSVPCIGALLQARKRSRLAVMEFHVSMYPISISPSLPLNERYMCEYKDLKNSRSSSPQCSVESHLYEYLL